MTIRNRLSMLAAFVGVFALVSVFMVVVSANRADAHGGLTFPMTRTYACYVDGREGGNGGNLDPTNPMCAAAWQQDSYGFWNWFGNLISDVGDQHRQRIADGELCGPGDSFSAFNAAPASAWPTTELQSGATIEFNYNAWAPHPGTWSQYITTDNWDPNTPLTWDELEPVPFDEITNPPMRSGGVEGAEYYWTATLPQKSGQHIIYSIWERSDSPEAFYNCSDVFFTGDGGNNDDTEAPTAPGQPDVGTVTGSSAQLSWSASSDNVGVSGYTVYNAENDQELASSSGTSVTLNGLTPETEYSVYVVANDSAGNTSSASPTVSFTTGSQAETSCDVSYDLQTWNGGFTAEVSVTNSGDSAINGWSLQWDFTNGETISQMWNGTYEQEGTSVMAQGDAWNSTLASGATASFGFLGNAPANAATPEVFALNGSPCTVT